MPYTAEITRGNPTCILFMIDQSRSMKDEISAGGEFPFIAHRQHRFQSQTAVPTQSQSQGAQAEIASEHDLVAVERRDDARALAEARPAAQDQYGSQ